MNKISDISRYIQMTEEIGNVSCHINNGGVTFVIGEDVKGQPIVRVIATHFGNITGCIELSLTQERIDALAAMFEKAKQHEFKGQSSVAAYDFHNPPSR